MFDMAIIDTDFFLGMPTGAQNLYFHLGMRADDDGFVSNPRKIQKIVGANDDDFNVLIAKKFIIPFENGIIVIRHWKLNNYLRKDRYTPTIYKQEKALLQEDSNGVYSLDTPNNDGWYTTGIPLGIPSIEKNSIDNKKKIYIKEKVTDWDDMESKKQKSFCKPTVTEIQCYCTERNNNIDPQYFFDFYESKGWYVGKNKMKDWKACVRTWERKEKENAINKPKQTKWELVE